MTVRDALLPTDRLAGLDFDAHNAEVATMWRRFNERDPYRIPIIVGIGARYFMLHRGAAPDGLDFKSYTEDPVRMYGAQLHFQRWVRHNVLQDAELGAPEQWSIHVDFQNYYEAAWFGCPVEYRSGEVPDAVPAFVDRPEDLLDRGLPDPFGGIMARGLEYYERFRSLAEQGFYDRPVFVHPPWFGMGSDGPMTVACSLFGAGQVCELMASNPVRLGRLLGFITDATAIRMEAWRTRYEVPVPQDGFGMADDSIALISTAMYREHVLPHHRRLYDRFGSDAPRSIHLCGNATRHFRLIRDELNVQAFDTGFPVDFGAIRRDLGPDVLIHGGPHVELLRSAAPTEVTAEVGRILASGIMEGGRFILREGNNLAPHTPLANIEAMYHAGRAHGLIASPAEH